MNSEENGGSDCYNASGTNELEVFHWTPVGDLVPTHPNLAPFARWLKVVWDCSNLSPTGKVPDSRSGSRPFSDVIVIHSSQRLPIVEPFPMVLAKADGTEAPEVATLLAEYVGVVELRFFPPQSLRSRLGDHLLGGLHLVVRIPAVSWLCESYTKKDVFTALGKEIIAATQNVEAADDFLIYKMIPTIRDLTANFLPAMGVTRSTRVPLWVNSAYPMYMYVYCDGSHQGIILHQRDATGNQLGFTVWDFRDGSRIPSHSALFHLQGTPTSLDFSRLDPPIVNAIRYCLQQQD
ncbi:hypothetical protein FRB91_011552 [Serendipita sp. 411]|nr:hypothetical protein FRB91_011552 [Serendipita sp. 411]